MNVWLSRWCAVLAVLGSCGAAAAADPVNRAVAIDLATDWQPLGGAFRFSVSPAFPGGAGVPVAYLCPTKLREEFFDKATGAIVLKPNGATETETAQAAACEPLTVQALPAETATPPESKYQAAVGAQLPTRFVSQATTYLSGLDNVATNGVFRRLLTGGTLHVHADGDTSASFRVGVTWRPLAALLTLGALFALAWTLARFALTERVPGPGNPTKLNLASLPIRLISGVDGRASLSQFQIMLWTFVVLGGAIYAVLVNGALIPISAGTLVLLGISGGAAVIAQAKATQDAKTATATPTPGPVPEASVRALTNSSDLTVAWFPPVNPSPVQQYRVGYRKVGAGPAPAGDVFDGDVVVRDLGVRLVGLDQNAKYVVKVRAETPAGNSDWTTAKGEDVDNATTTGVVQTPASLVATPAPADLDFDGQASTDSSITLTWSPPPSRADCSVQFRRADSREDWANASLAVPVPPIGNDPAEPQSATVVALDSGVAYNFRIRAKQDGAAWSGPLRATTRHAPRWSDLVTDDDQPGQIDVTRVQMLLFTLVTAGFVTMKVIDSSVIPDVPQEYLVLMGISNGIYLSAKWARR